jgi:hypothetical protein
MEEIARVLSTLTYMVEELAKEVQKSDPGNVLARNATNYVVEVKGSKPTDIPGFEGTTEALDNLNIEEK